MFIAHLNFHTVSYIIKSSRVYILLYYLHIKSNSSLQDQQTSTTTKVLVVETAYHPKKRIFPELGLAHKRTLPFQSFNNFHRDVYAISTPLVQIHLFLQKASTM